MNRIACLALLVSVVATQRAEAQDRLPSSTNPSERIVYRGDRPIQEEQSAQLMCYQWSSGQTGWDPEVAYAQLEKDYGQALQQYNSTRGAAVGGAARGAIAGLAIGAVAGDAGRGAAVGATAGGLVGARRGNMGRASAQEQFEAALGDFRSNFVTWDRHWVACMIGNGYGVA